MRSFKDVLKHTDCKYAILDNYGVLTFDGKFEPLAVEECKRLREETGLKIILISNATYLSKDAENRFAKKGFLKNVHYDEVITSGQYAFEEISKGQLAVSGKKFCVFGTANFKRLEDKVPDIFKGSEYVYTDDPEDADFVYCGVPQIINSNGQAEDRVTVDDFIPQLEKLARLRLPMVIANPDEMANEGGQFVVRQGTINKVYQSMGGETIVFGKPDVKIYRKVHEMIGLDVPKSQILMVGDTPWTDIKGANEYGIKSCLTFYGGVTEEMMRRDRITVEEVDSSRWDKTIAMWLHGKDRGIPDYIVPRIF